jgi:hypothetical protein
MGESNAPRSGEEAAIKACLTGYFTGRWALQDVIS